MHQIHALQPTWPPGCPRANENIASIENTSVRAQSLSHCVLYKATQQQQLAQQTAVHCCHIIQTRDTDFSEEKEEAICLLVRIAQDTMIPFTQW